MIINHIICRYGALVTRYPAAFIIGTVIITAAASTGFIVLEEEKDGLKLWQPKDSDFVKNNRFSFWQTMFSSQLW